MFKYLIGIGTHIHTPALSGCPSSEVLTFGGCLFSWYWASLIKTCTTLLFNFLSIMYPNEQSMLKSKNIYSGSIFPKMLDKTA